MKFLKLFILSGLLIQLSSCNQKTEQKPVDNKTIELTDGWARPGKAGMMSAAYFNIINNTNAPDTLLSVNSDASSNTQIHLSFENEEGLMAMEEQEFVVAPVGETVQFKQGGLHIMIIQPDKDLAEGDSVKLELTFSSGNIMQYSVPVRLQN
jgi:hypothetical protein